MGLLLWPIALVVLVAWSLFAWLLYGLSDGAAALLASMLEGVLSADLGPWAAWLLASLGDLLQIAVLIVWAAVGIGILAAPILLRRRRRAHAYPASYDSGYSHDRRYGPSTSWRRHGRQDLHDLRELAEDMVRQYRHKKKKKRWKYDD